MWINIVCGSEQAACIQSAGVIENPTGIAEAIDRRGEDGCMDKDCVPSHFSATQPPKIQQVGGTRQSSAHTCRRASIQSERGDKVSGSA